MTEHKVPIQSLIDHIKTAIDVDPWAKKMVEELLKEQEPKTGKWERQYSRPGVYANLFWWCSVCKEPTSYNDAGIFYKYCPRCGAKLEPCRET